MCAREAVELRVVEEMRVHLRRDVDTGVAELLRDGDQGTSVGEADACGGVPETVERDQRLPVFHEAGAALHALKQVAPGILRHRPELPGTGGGAEPAPSSLRQGPTPG